jgi:hypothetical protein
MGFDETGFDAGGFCIVDVPGGGETPGGNDMPGGGETPGGKFMDFTDFVGLLESIGGFVATFCEYDGLTLIPKFL